MGWQVATGVLAVTYLGVWLVFGVVCYMIYAAVRMPWRNEGLVGGAALVLAGVYALTPSSGRARRGAASGARCMARFRST